MEKNKDIEGVMEKTGPVGLYNYYKNNRNKVLFGNSCDFLSIIGDSNFSKQCSGIYNNYATTLWYEGSDWGGKKKESDVIKIISLKNPIDGSDMLWEESEFTKKKLTGLYYDIEEKKAIFQYAKNNKPNYGIIDIEAHIGDFSVSIALALKNIGRSDIIVYAIDPSKENCNFIEKMSLINSVSNIKILNYGLSDSEKILANNLAQKSDTKNTNVNLTNTYENESDIFILADTLFKKGEIGSVGVYYKRRLQKNEVFLRKN
jgi:FkbM family methyltransferase